MITNDGKEIISKYLLGHVPSYASHISVGCGATPLTQIETVSTDVYGKQRMDFEMTRVPISSKGFVDDSATYSITYKEVISSVATLTTSLDHDIVPGETVIVSNVDTTVDGQYRVTAVTNNTFSYVVDAPNIDPAEVVTPTGSVIVSRTKLSLTAELPTDNRYEITEVGVWSLGSNSLASQYDSRMIFNFTQSWQLHGTSITNPPFNSNVGFNGTSTTTDIQDSHVAFFANTNDQLFQTTTRKERHEGPRHLNTTLLLRGDMSSISGAINDDWTATGEHVHLNGINIDISGNNASDLFKVAMSMIDKDAIGNVSVDNVKILMEFYKTEVSTTSGFAKAQIYIPGSVLDANRYYVSSFAISQDQDPSNPTNSTALPYARFYTSADFSSSDVRICRIFVDITETTDPAGSHYINFDGFRLENTLENPIYKMSGYSVVKKDGLPVTKSANTNNYIDFRFSLGVG